MPYKKLAIATVIGAAVALGGAQAQTLRYSAAPPVLTMDPHATNDFVSQMVLSQLYEPLVGLNADLELVPGLAESWEHRGGKVWRFTLRQGVKFHEGQDFTAEDVAFSIERSKTSRFFTAFVGGVESVDIIDDYTVDITTAAPDPLMPRKMSNTFIMDKGWLIEHGAEEVPDLGAEASEVYTVRTPMAPACSSSPSASRRCAPAWFATPTIGPTLPAIFRKRSTFRSAPGRRGLPRC